MLAYRSTTSRVAEELKKKKKQDKKSNNLINEWTDSSKEMKYKGH